MQQRQKTGVSTIFNKSDLQREAISLSLFPEYFEENDDEVSGIAQ